MSTEVALFQAGKHKLRSGKESAYKIECDALTEEDWRGVAVMIAEEKLLPPFRYALGVPRGGVPFARAMEPYATRRDGDPVLICEDVVTTGESMRRYAGVVSMYKDAGAIGVCLFARGPCPDRVVPVFPGGAAYAGLVSHRNKLLDAAKQALDALVGSHAADDSVQGRARDKLRAAIYAT